MASRLWGHHSTGREWLGVPAVYNWLAIPCIHTCLCICNMVSVQLYIICTCLLYKPTKLGNLPEQEWHQSEGQIFVFFAIGHVLERPWHCMALPYYKPLS